MIDYERAVHDFGDRIFHAHAKDLEIRREGLYRHGTFSGGIGWQVPRLPGLGEVDWSRFVAALYAVGYDHVLSVEHEDRTVRGAGVRGGRRRAPADRRARLRAHAARDDGARARPAPRGQLGVQPSSVILAHVDRNPDAGEHAETAATGATLQLDGPGRAKYWPDSTILAADRRPRRARPMPSGSCSAATSAGGGCCAPTAAVPGSTTSSPASSRASSASSATRSRGQIFVANPARAFAWEPASCPSRLDGYTVSPMDGPFSLAGRRVVVTGASSGIGEAVGPGLRRRPAPGWQASRSTAARRWKGSSSPATPATPAGRRGPRGAGRGRMGRHRRVGQQRGAPHGEARSSRRPTRTGTGCSEPTSTATSTAAVPRQRPHARCGQRGGS